MTDDIDGQDVQSTPQSTSCIRQELWSRNSAILGRYARSLLAGCMHVHLLEHNPHEGSKFLQYYKACFKGVARKRTYVRRRGKEKARFAHLTKAAMAETSATKGQCCSLKTCGGNMDLFVQLFQHGLPASPLGLTCVKRTHRNRAGREGLATRNWITFSAAHRLQLKNSLMLLWSWGWKLRF